MPDLRHLNSNAEPVERVDGCARQVSLSNPSNQQGVGSGEMITINRVSIYVEPDGKDPMTSTDEQEEPVSLNKESLAAVAPTENVSGVRKMLINPAEEALDSARHKAEVIIKDAMEALQRTKQRLVEILPHSFVSSSAASSSTAAGVKKAAEEAKEQARSKLSGTPTTDDDSVGDEKSTEQDSSTQSSTIVRQPTIGGNHQFSSRSSPLAVSRSHSRL